MKMKRIFVLFVFSLLASFAWCEVIAHRHVAFRNGYPEPLHVTKDEADGWRVAMRNFRQIEGRVVRVSDGDTVTVLDAAKTQHKIRLLDIDAPESKQAFGQKCREHLASFIAGQAVRVTWKEKDQYGRILGTIWVQQFAAKNEGAPSWLNVNLQMVKDGYAWAYHYTKTPAYLAAMREAKAAKRGLWIDPNAQDPWAFRKAKRDAQKAKKQGLIPSHL